MTPTQRAARRRYRRTVRRAKWSRWEPSELHDAWLADALAVTRDREDELWAAIHRPTGLAPAPPHPKEP